MRSERIISFKSSLSQQELKPGHFSEPDGLLFHYAAQGLFRGEGWNPLLNVFLKCRWKCCIEWWAIESVWPCISMPQENVSSLLHGCILCRFSCPQSTMSSYYKIEKVPEINHNLANSWQNNCILISYCDWLQMKLYHGYIWIGKKTSKRWEACMILWSFIPFFLYPCVGLSSTVVPGCCRSLGIKENTASWVSRN